MASDQPGLVQSREGDASERPDEDEDDVSITSTDAGDNDCDKEWDVDDILAERRHPDDPDTMQYLIKWEGFELKDCTWEPLENLGDGLLARWEENKAEIEAKTREPFDLTIFEAACAERAERHARRNAKRQRLGLSLTQPFPPGYAGDEFGNPFPKQLYNSDDELNETDSASTPLKSKRARLPTGPSAKNAPTTASRAQKAPKQTMFRGIPAYGPSTSQTHGGGQGQSPYPSTRPATRVPTPGRFWSKSGGSRGGSLTGYQGTAGRTSAFRPPDAKGSIPTGPATSNPAPAAAGSPTSSSVPARNLKDKLFKATRTRQPAAPPAPSATNVFAGGKQPKKRQTLADVMADPTKAPKAFPNLRILNIAKKRAIEKGEVAGALTSIPSKFIINNDEANTASNKLSFSPLATAGPFTQTGRDTPHTPVLSPGTTQELGQPPMKSALQGGSGEVPASKPKKSVRFTGEDDNEPTSAIDSTVEPLDTAASPEGTDLNTRTPQPARKLSFENYQGRGQAQTIQKLVKFGHAEPVMASFTGITRHNAPWLVALKAEDILHFSATCSAFHFMSQKQLLIGEELSAGCVESTSPEHTTALENVAKSLLRSSIGLQLVANGYSILVYPARCEGWDQLVVGNNKCNPDASLRYLIFSSSIDPQAYPSEFAKDPEQFKKLIHPRGPDKSELIEVLTGLDFSQVLPQDPNLRNRQIYMLLIPLKAFQVLGAIMAWLRLHQPNRPIFTLEQPNSWYKFREAVQAGGAGGTIISHADFTLWKLEKIPGVWQMLEETKYTFWHLDTGQYKRPQFPSDLNAESVPGTFRLTRLFPYGRALFITPSFAISEPARLCELLKWFKQYASNTGYCLVACHGFLQFLRNITDEKRKEHNTLTWMNPDNEDVETFFERTGRRKQDIDNHFHAWELLQEIMEKFGDEETDEGIRKVHYLSRFIDPSDEQSLVNAFCWWTQLKLDRFRRFYVLGSDRNTIQRAYRYINIPRYFDTEGSNPDIAGILLQRQLFAVKLQEEADKHGTDVNIAWGTGGHVDTTSKVVGEWRSSICDTPFSFPGTTFRTGDGRELDQWIESHRRRYEVNWGRLHMKVVSWYDWNMGAQFGDGDTRRSQFDTFSSWFKSAPPQATRHNTLFGLFYTITDTWDEYMPQRRYERHPWIAIYRPKDVHIFKRSGRFKQIELFIWDMAANERAKGGPPLLDMQCKLIDYVYNNVPQHYPGCSLSSVWYSSTMDFPITPNDNPLDITCRQIDAMFYDMRKELPCVQPTRSGWAPIDPRLWTKGMSPVSLGGRPSVKPSALALERIPQTAEDKLKPERMVWHPVPRSVGRGRTKCLNDLYEACLKARLQDPECNDIQYQYRPTLEWWADQVDEGRDYGYIWVDTGERIIDRLPKKEQ
ncbi:hypothetical protein F4861DRAFT_207071 [Xylaria intraflava]|nr:hypothetical protein F4861DRAFT_207071 [Xylaria intraflava]